MRTTLAALVTLGALAGPAAMAQDRPQPTPTRDVAVTYRMSGGPQQNLEATMSWIAATRAMRMDLPGGMGFVVADHANQRGFMVMEAQRMIMDLPMEQAVGQMQAFENARFTRGAADRVAGIACTVWRFEAAGQTGNACITGDGVMLRSETSMDGRPMGMEAIRVVYGTQDPARYRRPEGYQSMQLPQGQPPRR